MDETQTNQNGEFRVSGSKNEISNIDPKVNLYHRCNYNGVSFLYYGNPVRVSKAHFRGVAPLCAFLVQVVFRHIVIRQSRILDRKSAKLGPLPENGPNWRELGV